MALYKKNQLNTTFFEDFGTNGTYFLRTRSPIDRYRSYLIWICIPENRWIWISVKSMRIRNTDKNSVILGLIILRKLG